MERSRRPCGRGKSGGSHAPWSVDCCPSPKDWDGWSEHWRMSQGLGKGDQQDPKGLEPELACCLQGQAARPCPPWLAFRLVNNSAPCVELRRLIGLKQPLPAGGTRVRAVRDLPRLALILLSGSLAHSEPLTPARSARSLPP